MIKKIIKTLKSGILRMIGRESEPLITVIQMSGVIGGGGFKQRLSLTSVEPLLDRAFAPSKLNAVAVVVNSPGGSPVQSHLITRRIRLLAEEKKVPVFTFAEDVAASGGYWLVCAGDEIFASPSSIIGSIGVISGGFGFTELLKKIGVERRLHATGDKKGMLDPFSPEKASDLKHLKEIQGEIHRDFKELVRFSRGDKLVGADKEIFSGAFWSGKKALELGLIDGLGDLETVLREKFGKNVRIKKIKDNQSFLKRKFGLTGKVSSVDSEERWSYSLVSSLITIVEEKLEWNRYGL